MKRSIKNNFGIFVIFLCAVLLFSGCSFTPKEKQVPAPAVPAPVAVPEPVAPVEEPVPVEAAPAEQPHTPPILIEEPPALVIAEPQPSPAPVPPVPPPSDSPSPYTASASGYADERVANLIESFKKAASYSFYYATSENWNLLRDQYLVKGSKVKIKLYEPNRWDKRTYFDTVYLDSSTQTAEAYCESHEQERCGDRTKKFTVEYADYKTVLPRDWLFSLPSTTQVVGGEQVENRAAVIVEYQRADGATVRISIDKFAGVPLMVQVYNGEIENLLERYLFKEMSINSVKSSDMVHTV